MERDSFVFYKSWYEAISCLSFEEQTQVIMALLGYALDGIEPDITSPNAKGYFALMKPQIDANNKKYQNGQKGKEHGQKGGRPKKEQNTKETPQKTQKNTKETPNVLCVMNYENENDILSSNENKIDKKNILKNIQKENSSLSFDAIINQALSDNEKSWHDALLQKYGIKNLEQAIEDYKMHIELYPRQEPITSLSEFKRHFANIANNYPNFISEKAKQYKPVPIAVEFEQNGKRYVRQFGLEVLLPDNAPAKPTDSVSYYWDDTSLYWRRYG